MHELFSRTRKVAVLERWPLVENGRQFSFSPKTVPFHGVNRKKHHFLNTFYSTGTYPLDVVRRRMQMKGATGELFKYNSTWHAFNVIAKTEGIHGLFKGMWPNLLKASIT